MQNPMSTIAIIGRPNVGKSTLFNKLLGKNKAIVAKVAGVTRDFQIEKVSWEGYSFHIVDTSGFEIKKDDLLQLLIQKQYERLLDRVDGFLFLCDGQSETTQLDHELLQKIRRKNKPMIKVVNKIDTTYFKTHEAEFFEFFRFI